MIALVKGKNRGYFEIEKAYDGKPYKSRFIQIEQVQENGEIRIEKINVPNNKEIINKVENLKVNEKAEIYVKFDVYNGKLTKKVVGV